MTTVLLADDHAIFLDGLVRLLERERFEIVAQVSDGIEAVRASASLHPDVAVLDISMPRLGGIEAARRIRRESPDTRSIILTMHEEDGYVLEALRAGVHGYVLKSNSAQDLVRTITEVAKGALYLVPEISATVMSAHASGGPETVEGSLTERECQVLSMLAEGQTTREMAQVLHLSPKTVDSHRARIMRKLNIHQTAGLVRFAIRHQLAKS